MAEKMTWTERLEEATLMDTGKKLVVEGVGGVTGFGLAGIIGRQIQNRIKKDPATGGFTTIADKLTAWSANNIPKIAVWYLLRKFAQSQEGLLQTGLIDASKATAVSLGFDTLVRLSHGGTNPGTVKIFKYEILGGEPIQQRTQSSPNGDIQRLIQENSALRSELNKALQRLATPIQPVQAQIAPAPIVHTPPTIVQQQPAPVVRYQPVPIVQAQQAPVPVQVPQQIPPPQIAYTPPAVQERQKRFSNMDTPPAVQEREKRFGTMESERKQRYGFMAGEEKDIAAMFGML